MSVSLVKVSMRGPSPRLGSQLKRNFRDPCGRISATWFQYHLGVCLRVIRDDQSIIPMLRWAARAVRRLESAMRPSPGGFAHTMIRSRIKPPA